MSGLEAGVGVAIDEVVIDLEAGRFGIVQRWQIRFEGVKF